MSDVKTKALRSARHLMDFLRKPVQPLRFSRPTKIIGLPIILIFALGAQFVLPAYVNYDLSMMMSYAVVGLGLTLLMGYNGQISLGHSAFFAVGAYTAALVVSSGIPYLWALPLSLAVNLVLGFSVGLPALRLRGLQLALVTLALALITPAAIRRFDELTLGPEGLSVILPEPPAWLPLDLDQAVYTIALICLVGIWIVADRLSHGSSGRSLIAVRENEMVARSLGISAARTKATMFAISAGIAGIGGTIYAYAVQFVAPDSFGLLLAVAFVAMVVVGGIGSLPGVIVGAAFVTYMPQWAADIDTAAAGLIYGAILVGFIMLMPLGVAGTVRVLVRRLRRRMPLAKRGVS